MEYGLIGKKLGHSFSKEIHERLAGYSYQLQELSPDELSQFLQEKQFRGINVTIPYKEDVMAYCNHIEPQAQRIGSVNTIVVRQGELYGYNTDYTGFLWMLDYNGIELQDRRVLILGSGATTRTVLCALHDRGVSSVQVVSRSGKEDTITYEQALTYSDTQIIINASPCGMYPHNGECLVQLEDWPNLEAVVDVVYNPLRTELLMQAEQRNIPAVNGLGMLVAQAKYAAEHFTGETIDNQEIAQIMEELNNRFSNLVLVGMPGSGKSSLGRELAKGLDKKFVDIDAEIVRSAGKSIPDIFAESGEEGFRRIEMDITQKISCETGLVISTGGGVVKNSRNIWNLRQNGAVVFIDCPVEQLTYGGGRPLSKSKEDLYRLEKERHNLYQTASDAIMHHSMDYQHNQKQIQKAAYQALEKRWNIKK